MLHIVAWADASVYPVYSIYSVYSVLSFIEFYSSEEGDVAQEKLKRNKIFVAMGCLLIIVIGLLFV